MSVAPERRGLERFARIFDFASLPDSRMGWAARIGITVLALFVVLRKTTSITSPLLKAKPPPAIPTTELEDYKFKYPERVRREIFAEFAAAEIAERKRAVAANTWNGHVWSREDDRGHFERVKARELAARYKGSLSQMYLILDEGIRQRWPGPDGQPLAATTPPFNPRTGW